MDWCKQERQSISKFMNTNWENSHISHLLSCLAFLLDSFLHFFFTLSDKRCGGAADLKKENVVLFFEVLTFPQPYHITRHVLSMQQNWTFVSFIDIDYRAWNSRRRNSNIFWLNQYIYLCKLKPLYKTQSLQVAIVINVWFWIFSCVFSDILYRF